MGQTFVKCVSMVQANKPIEWTNATGTKLEQMNEDCLLEIFSVKKLDVMDLCSIAETCERFRQVTQRIVSKEIVINSVPTSSDYNVKMKIYSMKTPNDVERIFKNFGPSLATVEISSAARDNFLLNLTTKHCNNYNLKSLTAQGFQILDGLTAKLNLTFKQLQRLNLWLLSVPTDSTIFADMDSLTDLSVYSVTNCCAILENTFPNLERFEYGKVFNVRTLKTLSKFIARHKKLTGFRLYVRCDERYGMTILQAIGSSCMELEDLGLFYVGSNLKPLQTLKSLRSLHLHDVTFEDLTLFSSWPELRELNLSDCKLPEDAGQIDFLALLTKLVISACGATVDVVNIIRRLTNLRVLGIWLGFVLDVDTFSEIVSIVKGRQNVLTLMCNFNFTENNADKNHRVRLIRS